MDKKKPIGYTKEQTKSMKALIERTQEKAGDYVGSGTVTEVPKKKKKMKRMMDGGMANAMMQRGTQPNERGPIKGAPDYTTMPIRGPGGRVRGGGGVPVQGPGGVVVPPLRDSTTNLPAAIAQRRSVPGPGGVVVPPMRPEGKKIPGQIRDRLMGMMGQAGKGAEYPGMPKMGGMMARKAGMKGGGLARKGVGMALAKGGLVKANGCAKRGKTKGRMV